MKRIKTALFFCVILISAYSCSHRDIQETYWEAGTSVALDEEKKGNIQNAETELKVALGRAKRELDDEKVASSLHNLGAFYRRQDRLSAAIDYLNKALKLEEKVSGPESERIGRTLAELAAAYAMEGNYYEGRPHANRLKPLAKYFSGNKLKFVEQVLDEYAIDTEIYSKEVAKLKPLADSGDPEAQYKLAAVYFDGPDAKERMPDILSLYKNSAERGYAQAQYYLGVMYDKGRGIPNDDVKAREWYRKAAENSHPIGQFNYAVFLWRGRGGPQNKDEAKEWNKKSADQGYPSSIRALKQNRKY